jgi:hypothetical protein
MIENTLENTLHQLSVRALYKMKNDDQLSITHLYGSAFLAGTIRSTYGNCQIENFCILKKEDSLPIPVIAFKLSHEFLKLCFNQQIYSMNKLYWHLEIPNPNNFTPVITTVVELLARSKVVISENCGLTEMNKIDMNDELLSVL